MSLLFTWLPQSLTGAHLLAESEATMGEVMFWCILLFILVIVLFVGVIVLRKKFSPDEDFHHEGFTLGDLRQMVKSGKMSPEEFDRAKEVLLATMKPAAKPPDPSLGDLPGGRSLRSED